MRVPFGYVARKSVGPVEENALFHVQPGARALTFGMFGSGLHSSAHATLAFHDEPAGGQPLDVTAGDLVLEAIAAGCKVICAACDEPTISAEWVRAVFSVAKRNGLTTALISSGDSTTEALTYVKPVTDVLRVDLKGFSEESYQRFGGHLAPVLASIREAKRLGFWVEVVTQVEPGLNDDIVGLSRLASELCSIDSFMPWHIDALTERDSLRPDPLLVMSAAGAAYARGLRFVYVGDSPITAELCHTRCPSCHELLIGRHDHQTCDIHIRDGACPQCKTRVPGVFCLPALAPTRPALPRLSIRPSQSSQRPVT